VKQKSGIRIVDTLMDLLSDAGSIPAASTIFWKRDNRKLQGGGIGLKEIVVATSNPGKLCEIKDALQGMALEILSLMDLSPGLALEEDGRSFRENALKKARVVAKLTDRLTIADDSGLEVDALQGMPGVRSARFAGEGATDAENNRKLLQLLGGVPSTQRGATFRCVIALVSPEGKEKWVEGVCRGVIGATERGSQGFGYDPLFLLPELGKTLAELSLEEKNRISHRGRALSALKEKMVDFL
jgi:XTP/dITP diphosphohydrolase